MHALLENYSNKRPFFTAPSTFAGSFYFVGSWEGGTSSEWANMCFEISQALQFSIVDIPYLDVEHAASTTT